MRRERGVRIRRLAGLALVWMVPLATVDAQATPGNAPGVPATHVADSSTGAFGWLTQRFSGQTQLFSELYGIDGQQRRRPGSTWRMMARRLTNCGTGSSN